MEGDGNAAKVAAQRQSVWARRTTSLEVFAERMPAFADVEPQTADALGEYLGLRRATLYRRFGQSPVRGAYVLACCQHLYAPWRALRVFQEHSEQFPGLWSSRRRAFRALAYVFIAAIAAQRRLFERGHLAASSGALLRDVDLIAIIGRERAKPAHTTLQLDEDGVVPRSFEYIPLLCDAAAGFLSFIGLPRNRAPEIARHIVEVGVEDHGPNIMGAANRVLSWATMLIGIADAPSAEIEEMWLTTQLAERQALRGPAEELSHMIRLLQSGGGC